MQRTHNAWLIPILFCLLLEEITHNLAEDGDSLLHDRELEQIQLSKIESYIERIDLTSAWLKLIR